MSLLCYEKQPDIKCSVFLCSYWEMNAAWNRMLEMEKHWWESECFCVNACLWASRARDPGWNVWSITVISNINTFFFKVAFKDQMSDICWAYSCVWSMVSSQLFFSFKRRYDEVYSFAFVLGEIIRKCYHSEWCIFPYISFYFLSSSQFCKWYNCVCFIGKRPKLKESKYFAQWK